MPDAARGRQVRIGIIGVGQVGSALARGLRGKGHGVVLGTRDMADPAARRLADEAGASLTSPAGAAAGADIVILALPWAAAEAAVRGLGDLAGKIVIDCMNPLGMVGGALGLTVGHTTSGAEILAGSAAAGLVVRDLVAEGRRRTTEGEIVQALSRYRGMPLLAVDLPIVQQRLEQLPWVRTATVRRELPDTLVARITEHRPVAIWHQGQRRRLLGSDGEVIPVRDLRGFNALPVIVGAAAPERIGALLTAMAHEPELARRVRRAALVGGRRWTVWLDPQIEVRLPEEEVDEAWRYLAARQREGAILARAIDLIDLRRKDWLVVRTAGEPTGPRPAAGQGA